MKRSQIDEVAVSILTRLHERYELKRIDDSEYIPMIKYAIQGACDSAEENDLSEAEQIKLSDSLYNYAKGLYITGCVLNRSEEDTIENTQQESNEWFEYIYEHEHYPE